MKKQLILLSALAFVLKGYSQVGIGTTAPSEALDIEVSTTTNTSIGLNNTSTGDPVIHFQLSGVSIFSLGVDNSDGSKFKIGTTGVETSTFLTIDSDGDLGINDSDPAYKVEVDGEINLSNSTDVYRIGSAHVLSKPNTNNIYIGQTAGAQNNAAGTDNTFLGFASGYSNTSADYNLFIGNESGYSNQDGGQNVFVGYQAGYSNSSGTEKTVIGHQAGYGSTGSSLLYIDNSSSSNPLLYVSSFSATNLLTINGGLIVNEQSGDFDFRVESDANENRLLVDASADQLLIGTSSPVGNEGFTTWGVNISGTDNLSNIGSIIHSDDAIGSSLNFMKSRGSEASPTVVSDDDYLGVIRFSAHDGTDYTSKAATIEARVNGTPGVADMPTELRFQTTADGSSSSSIKMLLNNSGYLGIGNWTPLTRLDVSESSNTVATFNRTTDDGVLWDIQKDGTSEGTIEVSGTTLTYNAFTGSHFAHSFNQFERGMVVIMNGENDHYHHCENSEILYGIEYSSLPNDKRVLGAYLSLLNPSQSYNAENPHQVMAVGNGEMWVTNEGGNINQGDFLITSSTVGHAMKDNKSFATSYICAKAAEFVDWSNIKPNENGIKRAKISVVFESFEVENIDQELKQLEADIQILKEAVIKL